VSSIYLRDTDFFAHTSLNAFAKAVDDHAHRGDHKRRHYLAILEICSRLSTRYINPMLSTITI